MQTQTNMNANQMTAFDVWLVGYINDNLKHIYEMARDKSHGALTQAALNHYNHTAELSTQSHEQPLSIEQRERFIAVATRLFKEGHVAGA
jgi:hypothetical protein